MNRSARILTICPVILTITNCNFIDQCSSFPHTYSINREDLDLLPSVKKSKVVGQALRAVSECYPRNRYLGDVDEIAFEEARKKGSEIYLIYEPLGVTDVKLVFVANQHGAIVRAYQYPVL